MNGTPPRPSASRRLLKGGARLAFSLLAGLTLTELALRAAGYHFSPIAFVRPDNIDDHRVFHMGGRDLQLRAAPLTVADPDLLWRLDPRSSRELTPEGFRGGPFRTPGTDERLVLALGDSNTIGPLDAPHWPGVLQELLRVRAPQTPAQVVNAGVYGYTSFQGLRAFRSLRRYRPDVVFFSFGANDAHPVRRTDAQYAARLDGARRWSVLRVAPPLLHLAWRAGEALGSEPEQTFRVPLADYRRNLESFVADAREIGATPVLMTRPFLHASEEPANLLHYVADYNAVVREVAAGSGVRLLDAARLLEDAPERFTDTIHNDAIGYTMIAEAALDELAALGFTTVAAPGRLAAAVDLARADSGRLELGPGFWPSEVWPNGVGGRWTQDVAVLELGRFHGERSVAIELTIYRPAGVTRGFVDVNGFLTELPIHNGRYRLKIALPAGAGERVRVRLVIGSAYRHRDVDPKNQDARVLGAFVHRVALEP